MTAVIETSGLTKRYRRVTALSDCTVSVPEGRISALVGPNGAGKTTLLRLLAGLALAEYESRRQDRVADMVKTSWWIGAMGRPRSALACGLRNAFMRATFDTFALRQSYSLMLDSEF